MGNMTSQLIGYALRYGLTALGAYLATHGNDGASAYVSSNVDTIIGLVLGAVGLIAGGHHAATTVAVPKNDPVAAKVAADKIAQDASIRGH